MKVSPARKEQILFEVKFDLLVAEQLHDIVPCRHCERAAHWYVKCSGCGWLILRCGKHRAETDAEVLRSGGAACATCKTVLYLTPPPFPWVAL